MEPVRVRPEFVPARVPPVLLKSTLPAKAATGNAKASSAIIAIRFMIKSSYNLLENSIN
jgi:hypothetical protein